VNDAACAVMACTTAFNPDGVGELDGIMLCIRDGCALTLGQVQGRFNPIISG
jgi:hypothetical protein